MGWKGQASIMPYLTDHFTLEEMTKSSSAERAGIPNKPNTSELANILATARRMEIVRGLLGDAINVLSCYRSEAVNTLVGGSKTSAHRYGLAVDFTCPSFGDTRKIANLLAKHQKELGFDQLILEFPDSGSTWVHIGWSKGKPRGQLLTAVKVNGKTKYLQGIK